VHGGAPWARGANLEDRPDVAEERGEHPSMLAGDGRKVARHLWTLAEGVRERVEDR
jgi:hypothetical protein